MAFCCSARLSGQCPCDFKLRCMDKITQIRHVLLLLRSAYTPGVKMNSSHHREQYLLWLKLLKEVISLFRHEQYIKQYQWEQLLGLSFATTSLSALKYKTSKRRAGVDVAAHHPLGWSFSHG